MCLSILQTPDILRDFWALYHIASVLECSSLAAVAANDSVSEIVAREISANIPWINITISNGRLDYSLNGFVHIMC